MSVYIHIFRWPEITRKSWHSYQEIALFPDPIFRLACDSRSKCSNPIAGASRDRSGPGYLNSFP